MVCGILLSLATGLVENGPEFSIIGFDYYGFPLVWRVTKTLQPTEFLLTNFAIDIIFWIAVSFFASILLKIVFPKMGETVKWKALLLPLVLLIPLGLVMDFVHEFGHAIWGVSSGGTLTYMKIAYFEIYPRVAIDSQFNLGSARVNGIPTNFGRGLYLLGGSLTTNIVSWLLALILLKTKIRYKTKIALSIPGLFGLLDLPLYVILPQIGLHHWVFLGGCTPEPLIGARMMGIPDPAFYIAVVLTTLGLVFLYLKSLSENAVKGMKSLLGTFLFTHGNVPDESD